MDVFNKSLQDKVDYLITENIQNKNEIDKLKNIIEELLNKKEIVNVKKIENHDKNVSIIIRNYKKSILVKNMYSTHNTTIKCKDILKEIGGKWFKNETDYGWLFVGSNKDTDKSIEINSKFIIDKLECEGFKLDIEYL